MSAERAWDDLAVIAPAPPPPVPTDAPGEDPGQSWATPIDWASFWTDPGTGSDFVLPPFIAAKRQTAIYSAAKTGKSLLALDAVAAGVTGRSVLGQGATAPIRVLYIDQEMTPEDLRERLTDLGYGPADDLSGLAYYQLASLPPLDTDIGGEVLMDLVHQHGADLVVVDTMARVVSGDENQADTYRSFYRHTGRRLKADGVALLRLDHAGKDSALGQRGSSAKADDLDVVYRLVADDATHLRLTCTHRRVPWVPTSLELVRHEEPILRHVVVEGSWPAGTVDVAHDLDRLDVPVDAPVSRATAALKVAGSPRRKATVAAAQRYRKARS